MILKLHILKKDLIETAEVGGQVEIAVRIDGPTHGAVSAFVADDQGNQIHGAVLVAVGEKGRIRLVR